MTISDLPDPSDQLDLDTYSLLAIPIQTNLLTSGNLKVKCVVSMWNLFHKSNEISVEIQGLDPNPKSIRHSDAKNISKLEISSNKYEEIFHSVESGQSKCSSAIKSIFLFLFVSFIRLWWNCTLWRTENASHWFPDVNFDGF